MGAYLLYKLADPTNAEAANEWLADQPEYNELTDATGMGLRFQEADDLPYDDKGEGQYKTSAIHENRQRATELIVELFRKLHNSRFEPKVYSGSCSLRRTTFSLSQMETLTDSGDALTGSKAQMYRRMFRKAEVEELPFTTAVRNGRIDAPDWLPESFDWVQWAPVVDHLLVYEPETVHLDGMVSETGIDEDQALEAMSMIEESGAVKACGYSTGWYWWPEWSQLTDLLPAHNEAYGIENPSLTN